MEIRFGLGNLALFSSSFVSLFAFFLFGILIARPLRSRKT